MSYRLSFRDINAYGDETGSFSGPDGSMPPGWVVLNKKYADKTEKYEALLHWKNFVFERLLEWREPVTRVQRTNIQLYKGLHYLSQEEFSRLPYNRNKRYDKNHAKIVVNNLRLFAEQHVADMTAYDPNLIVMPNNSEEQDKVSARLDNEVLQHYLYEYKVKELFQVFHRRKKVQGETFMFCTWDPNRGDFHPSYKKMREMRQRMGMDPDMPVPLIDPETGQPVIGDSGDELFITKPVKVGDLNIHLEYSENVLYPYNESGLWSDVPYIIHKQILPVDEVKAMYPEYANDIRPDNRFAKYMNRSQRYLSPMVCLRTLYHKPTRFCEAGGYVVSVENKVLECAPYPYAHKQLPCIRGTDIDVPGQLTGMSFFQDLVTLQHAVNNSKSMILQNQMMYAYPKYAVPRAAKVKHADLDDDRGVYEYSGAKGPELITPNSTPADTWKWSDVMTDDMKTLSQIYATSQGRGVDGITANVALRMIDEQERKLHKPAIDKHSQNCVDLGTQIISCVGTFRDPSDGTMISIVGKNNERMLKYFDSSNLAKSTEVRLQRSSGLPETGAARTQTILDFSDRFEGLWENDEILEMMDMERPEKLIESATVSRQAAESEVEDILSGIMDVPPPQPYHDILPRYRVYEKAMQSRSFDEALPDRRARLMNHVLTAEYLIWRKSKLNMAFQQLVMTGHPNFPMLFPQPMLSPEPFALATAPDPATMLPPGEGGELGGVSPEAAAGAPGPAPQQSIPNQSALPQESPMPSGSLP